MQLLELVQYLCRCVYLQLNILPYIIFIAIGYLFINMFDSWATWKLTVGWDPKLMQQYERQWLNKICLYSSVMYCCYLLNWGILDYWSQFPAVWSYHLLSSTLSYSTKPCLHLYGLYFRIVIQLYFWGHANLSVL